MKKLFNSKIFKLTIVLFVLFIQFLEFDIQKNNIKNNKYNSQNTQVSYTNVVNTLNSFYNKLKFPDTYILNTNKFLCAGINVTCNASAVYSKIGLLNQDEYTKIGADSSYLTSTNSYWTMTESGTQVYKITADGIEIDEKVNSSGIRPTVYLKSDLKITGKGITSDPYVLAEKTLPDLNFLAMYVDGVKTDSIPTTGYYNLNSYTCNRTGIEINWGKFSRELTIKGLLTTPLECTLNFVTQNIYADSSGANIPELAPKMIPIKFDGINIVYANVADNWYDYSLKQWANAVILISSPSKTYNVGDVISAADIAHMFVWIPRYKYTIFNGNRATAGTQVVSLAFETGIGRTGTVSCTDNFTGGTSETCTDATNGSIINGTSTYTHPAFKFGTKELTGIWMGKFELSGTAALLKTLPNAVQFSTDIVTYFNSIKNIKTVLVLSNIDTHMIKNMEWGAAAYLKQSQYGLGTTDIGINNYYSSSSTFLTGCGNAAGTANETTCNAYNTANGMLASTTGNITGIYDMSGGKFEYVMGNMKDTGGLFTVGSSGFTVVPEAKYYDAYANAASNTNITYVGKLGDATREFLVTASTTGWYSDSLTNPYGASYPWFARGGYMASTTSGGIFNSSSYFGNSYSYYGSRAVLTLE